MVNPRGSLRQDPRGSVRNEPRLDASGDPWSVGGTLVRGGSDPGLLRAAEVGGRQMRRSACSLPASLAAERSTPSRERATSGASARMRVVKVTKEHLDLIRRSRVRQTFPGREHRGREAAAGQAGRAAAGLGVSAALNPATHALVHSTPVPSAAGASKPAPPAAAAPAPAAAPVPAAAASTSGIAAPPHVGATDPRPRRYRKRVASLASVLRREESRAPHRGSRRRPERDAKSRKYVAGSGSSRTLRARPLWRPAVQVPPPDPVKPRGGPCCCYPSTMRTTPCSALVLLPLHLMLLVTLVACLVMGAFVFHALEGTDGGSEEAVEVRRNAIVLPSTPRDPIMRKAREEAVDRLLNASLTLVLHRSLDVIIDTIFTTRKMQNALKAYQQGGGEQLPTEEDVEKFSHKLMMEWRHALYDVTARYHALIVRHANGFQVGTAERQAVWDGEEPPPPLPWTLPTALLYSFCLVTTTGGLQATTEGGRAAGVAYSLMGVTVYVGVVVVWAARLGATFSLIINFCSRRKVDTPTRKSKGGTSPYHKMQSHPAPPPPPLPPPTPFIHTPARITLLAFVLFLYIVGVGAPVLGGGNFWTGLENAIFALLTIRPPRPLPETVGRVTGYMVYTMWGHLLLGLLLYSVKELCVRWWRLWGRTS